MKALILYQTNKKLGELCSATILPGTEEGIDVALATVKTSKASKGNKAYLMIIEQDRISRDFHQIFNLCEDRLINKKYKEITVR